MSASRGRTLRLRACVRRLCYADELPQWKVGRVTVRTGCEERTFVPDSTWQANPDQEGSWTLLLVPPKQLPPACEYVITVSNGGSGAAVTLASVFAVLHSATGTCSGDMLLTASATGQSPTCIRPGESTTFKAQGRQIKGLHAAVLRCDNGVHR